MDEICWSFDIRYLNGLTVVEVVAIKMKITNGEMVNDKL